MIQYTIDTKKLFLSSATALKVDFFLYECKKYLCNYMKHCYQHTLLQNNLSSQHRFAKRDRVIEQNQLWKPIKIINFIIQKCISIVFICIDLFKKNSLNLVELQLVWNRKGFFKSIYDFISWITCADAI